MNDVRRPPDELKEIRAACAGLMFPSESDAPFEPFTWEPTPGRTAKDQVAARAGKGMPIEVVPVEIFFAALAGTEDAESFKRLRQTLQSKLAELTVVRVGEVKVAIYLIGKTRSGRWAGLQTTSVET